jgi:hypothetical protein
MSAYLAQTVRAFSKTKPETMHVIVALDSQQCTRRVEADQSTVTTTTTHCQPSPQQIAILRSFRDQARRQEAEYVSP